MWWEIRAHALRRTLQTTGEVLLFWERQEIKGCHVTFMRNECYTLSSWRTKEDHLGIARLLSEANQGSLGAFAEGPVSSSARWAWLDRLMASTSTSLWHLKKITFRARSVLRFFWVLSSKVKKGGTSLAQVPRISRDSVAAGRAGERAQMLSLRCSFPSLLLAGLSWVSLFQGPMCPAARGLQHPHR